MQMFHRMQDDARCLESVIFSDESTFLVNGKVTYPQLHYLGQQVCDGSFFMGMTITGIMYQDMLQQFLIPQMTTK
jgi:hypothetical protein